MFSTRKLSILCYIVEGGEIRPDSERLRPLLQLPVPKDAKSLRRVLGFLSHYSQWIHRYSKKIRLLTKAPSFSIFKETTDAFKALKRDIECSVVSVLNEELPFEIETNASNLVIAATLNQNGRPVALF